MVYENEKEIIQRICAGEEHLFRFIIERYQQRVASLCYKLAGRSLNIEEISQQVFIELYKAVKKFRFQSQFSTFVYKLTLNTVSKALKKQKKILFIEDVQIFRGELQENDFEEQQLQEDRFRELHKAIVCLKENQRTALCLHVFEDVSYKEIASTMGISVSAVESLIFRAKISLRKSLSENNAFEAVEETAISYS